VAGTGTWRALRRSGQRPVKRNAQHGGVWTLARRTLALALALSTLSTLPITPPQISPRASASELPGPPDADGNWARCQVMVGPTNGVMFQPPRYWGELACQLAQAPKSGIATVATVTIPTSGSPVLINFPDSGYLGGLKYRKRIHFTSQDLFTNPLSGATVRVLDSAGTMRPAGWDSPPSKFLRWGDRVSRRGPAIPVDHWPGGSPGGERWVYDPYLRTPILDERGSYGNCAIKTSKDLPADVRLSPATILYVRCNVPLAVTGMSIRVHLFSQAAGVATAQWSDFGCTPVGGGQPQQFACDIALPQNGWVDYSPWLRDSSISLVNVNTWGTFLAFDGLQTGSPSYPLDYYAGGVPGGPSVPLEQTFGQCDTSLGFASSRAGCQSDPVSGPSGSFVYEATDVEVPSPGVPFTFTRSYTSADTSLGPLGPGWTHNLNVALSMDGSGNATVRAEKLAEIHARNLRRYGDPLGPSIEWLRAQGKTWEQIIESATRTDGRDLGF
jgi:hypothetical protein